MWWLQGDGIAAVSWLLGGGGKERIFDAIHRMYHHAHELNLESTLKDRIYRLAIIAYKEDVDYWTESNRREAAYELRAILTEAGIQAQRHQVEKTGYFHADPAPLPFQIT